MNRPRWQDRMGGRAGTSLGVSLIEALIALVVMVGGVAAIFGIHSYVVSSGVESRVQTAAMSLAQDRLEQFRNSNFDELAAGEDAQAVVIVNPGVARSFEVQLRACWDFDRPDDPSPPPGLVAGLVQANVWVIDASESCNAPGEILANVSTLLAEQDPRVGPRTERTRIPRSDGDGQIVDVDDLPDPIADLRDPGAPPGPGGFELVKDADGNLVAVINPESDKAMIPKNPEDNPNLKIATIHGNLLIRGPTAGGPVPASEVFGLGVEALGVAFCRVHYPDPLGDGIIHPNDRIFPGGERVYRLASDLPVWPEVSAAVPVSLSVDEFDTPSTTDHHVAYLRYSCIAADQWQRLIYLTRESPTTPGSTVLLPQSKRVCTGEPRMQPGYDSSAYPPAVTQVEVELDGTASLVWPPDVLRPPRSPSREYYGHAGVVEDGEFVLEIVGETEYLKRVSQGVRGAIDGESAVMGSLCLPDEECWSDEELRGWVPGGHHFFIDDAPSMKPGDGYNSYCADSMGILTQIDRSAANLPKSRYSDILILNPERVFCTNDKEYTKALISRFLAGDLPRRDDCLSFTRASGFMTREVSSTSENLDGADIFLATTGVFAGGSCGRLGRFAADGGAYVCGFDEGSTSITMAPLHRLNRFTFAPDFEGRIPVDVDPLVQVPHDVALMNFVVIDEAVIPELTVEAEVVTTDPSDPTKITAVRVTGTAVGVADGPQVILLRLASGGDPVEAYADLVDGVYEIASIDVSALGSGTIMVDAIALAISGAELIASTTVTPGVQPPPPSTCKGLVLKTTDNNLRRANSIVYGGTSYSSCTKDASSFVYTCTVPVGVTVTIGEPVSVRYQTRNNTNANFGGRDQTAVGTVLSCTMTGFVLP